MCEKIINIMKQSIVPATGCTEPIAVAYAAAKSREVLGTLPTTIIANLSGNIIKNATGVYIPGTNTTGLKAAIALGLVCGDPGKKLGILEEVKLEDVNNMEQYIAEHPIMITQAKNTNTKLFIEIIAYSSNHSVSVTIEKTHTNITRITKDGILLEPDHNPIETNIGAKDKKNDIASLNLQAIYNFSKGTPLNNLEFILTGADMNKNAAIHANNYYPDSTLGDSISLDPKEYSTDLEYMISLTTLAIDARMRGACIPIMSNSGSGDQGIVSTLPILAFAEKNLLNRESLIRALTMSQLTTIYTKSKFGVLSSVCGLTMASIGTVAGLTFIAGGSFAQIEYAITNLAANITGMICDGAKPGCALKAASCVFAVYLSFKLAMRGKSISSAEGIIGNNVESTIDNMIKIACEGMASVDDVILDIITNKKSCSA
ncbi:MAG: L-serine ammonia-lyase, iron-sulfur-dependent, subunit alpha [Bacilli bacterium]|jgi:L-cysteine desulfidase